MSLLQAIVLGVLQGATEFLPISSSGHLVLVPWLLGWAEPGLTFDAVMHWGTALAVIAYFWRDWWRLIVAGIRSITQRSLGDPDARLAWLIVLGTIPAVVLGLLFEDFFEQMFSNPVATAALLLVTAGILTGGEALSRRRRELTDLTWRDGLIIGLAQALAILPGISRSGSTISAGLVREVRREPAARFSFLLGTPAVLGAGLLKLVDLAQAGDLLAQAPILLVGFGFSAAVGIACIHFLLRFLRRRPLYVFAVYCAIAGVFCLLVALVRGG